MPGDSRGPSERRDEPPIDEGAAQSGEMASAEGGPKADGAAKGSTPSPSGGADAVAQAETARMKEAWLRTAADFDNFKKRSKREVDEARRSGREELLRTLLPVFDNLERALQSAQRTADVKAMADGLSMVQRQFTDALGREGIGRVPTIGHPFDPGLHEAIQQVETDEHAAGTVIAEVQPGYLQGERLLRAAMVVVARARPSAGETGADSSDAN